MLNLTTFQFIVAALIGLAIFCVCAICVCSLAAEPVEQDEEYL